MRPQNILLAAGICLLLSACKKHVALPVYNISYEGVEMERTTLSFNGGISCSKYEWDFGDGHKSAQSNPVHAYANAGIYDVSLVVNDQKDQAVHRTVTVYKDPTYTQAMCKPRKWQHTWMAILPDGNYGYNTFSDTSFGIKYVNPLVIVMGSDTMRYVSDKDAPGSLHFKKTKYDPSSKLTQNLHLYYYFGSDSIWCATGYMEQQFTDFFITKE